MSGRQIKELYYKVWSNLRESKTEVLQYFLNWDEKSARKNGAKRRYGLVEALEKVGVFQRLRSVTSAGLQGPQYVKLQFSRHHRQLRSRYELSLGMHLRDQLALGVTPLSAAWTAFLSMLIGLFCTKTFRQKLEYLLEQISRCGCYHIGLLWQTLKFSLQITRVHADGSGSKSWIAMMFQTVDLM
ncbi:AIS_collapsed_G0016670.mRNA.1.CDS.1 [Saccharomyces cerevisiae]|nr:AIS_collapsed_G0016670.mRNA.1.CDS.1 [Saccharomyces cerevisiae]